MASNLGRIDMVPRPVPAHRLDAPTRGVCGGCIVGFARAQVELILKGSAGMVKCA